MTPIIERYQYDGEGYKPLLIRPNWMVAILNWEPAAERRNLREVERHNKTDEVFVLMEGRALLFARLSNGQLEAHDLDRNVVYNVPAGIWHSLVCSRDARLLIIENRDTHLQDTECRTITQEEFGALEALLPNWVT